MPIYKKFFLFLFLLSTFYFLNSGFVSADTLNQTVLFNIDSQYEALGRKQASATLRKISDRAYWYVSDDYWAGISSPEQTLFLNKLDELAREFDTRIYPAETQFWGSEASPGIDGDPRVTILLTKLIDQAGGYFDSTHLYKKSQAPDSNEREMVFVNIGSVINNRAKIFLAHEFQHLIGFYQKDILKNIAEDVWLNEARAEYAPRLLGYDDIFETSNLRRRLFAFQQNPSDPLAEWKNESSDYGAVTLFMYYLVDNYGDKILADSLKSSKAGIESINEFLFLNGLTETFSDVFSNWTIANVLNDETINPRFSYKFQHLKNFKVSPAQSYSISGLGANISISNFAKDWQPFWYEFNTPVTSAENLNLKIDFMANTGTRFKIPYIAFYINGQKEIGFVPVSGSVGAKFIKNFGSEVYKVAVIPANHSKISDFTKDDSTVGSTLKAQLTSEFEETTLPTPSADALIQNLLNQIRALQEQIAQLRNLSRDLFVGSQGEDVRWLQEFLISQDVYPEALKTGYFGPLTRDAVIKFQQKHGIFPQIGYVGTKTRAKILEIK